MYPRAVEALITSLSRLPGVGRKTAERLALHLVRASAEEARELAAALTAVKEQVRACSLCRNLADRDPCSICTDPNRDGGQLCLVESPADLAALEAAGSFGGRYFVLAGALSPLEGVGPDNLHLDELLKRVKQGGVREVIIATNPTVEGEATADLLARSLEPSGVSITRLGYGMPVGGDLKYMVGLTLARSLASRKKV
ncbi:MAG: recombination mediator RecR [Pseudomonadota bacterium]